MSQKTTGDLRTSSEMPSHVSQDLHLGRLGSFFEYLSRREKDLISGREKIKKIPIRNRVGESLPKLPSRFLPDPPPPYFDRIIVGHGLPVEYRQSEDGEHYLKDGVYYFRPLNPAHPANAQAPTPKGISEPQVQNLEF